MIFEWLLKVIVVSGIAFAAFFAFLLLLDGDFAQQGVNIVAAILTFFATMFTAVLGANTMYAQMEKRNSSMSGGGTRNPGRHDNGNVGGGRNPNDG